jgi:predicted acylesterase/phospholipase RssA
MPQKLAIAIRGAVALSSYEAGILYEMIEAIAQHNCHPDTMDEQRIEIDVITGVSAGAMTACILAQKLMFEAEALRQPHANALYGPWVEDMDITELLKLRLHDDPQASVFSAERMAEIGYTYLLQRYATGQPTPRQRHPAAADSIRVGLAMANLQGSDGTVNLTDFPDVNNPDNRSPALTYTRHSEWLTYQISDRDADDHPELWQKLERIARSSSTVPFLLRPPQIDPIDLRDSHSSHQTAGFPGIPIDGSLFKSDPLDLAKNLVDQTDRQHLDHPNRFYLYVAPSAKTLFTDRFAQNQATPLATSAALMNALFTNAGQNWIRISQMNEKIRQFERQAKELSDVLIKSPHLKTSFSSIADHLLTILYRQDAPSAEPLEMETDQERLRQQFTEEYERIVYATQTGNIAGEEVAKSWLRLVQALEKIQHLGDKDVMTVYAITPEERLTGEQPFALGGLLDQSLRDADYNTGRRQAVHFLTRLQTLNQHGKSEGQLYLTNFTPGHNLRPSESWDEARMDWIPAGKRRAVKSQLLARTQHIIDASESRFWVRWLLKLSLSLFLSRQIDRLLELEN